MAETSTSYRKGKKPGPGRPKGLPNKSTSAAREAIGRFVDDNAGRFQGWLDDIANGIPALDAQGNPVLDQAGRRVWVRPPDPEKAFDMVQKVIEYHVPKLNRSETHLSGSVGIIDGLKELDGSV